MPAPFVMPTREYVTEGQEGRVKVRESSLGNVSVVHIALAAASQESCEADKVEYAVGIPERILCMGRRWPITPVDITRVWPISSGGRSGAMHLSTAWDISKASFNPPCPVTAFAQPAFMAMARKPSPWRQSSIALLTVTGAARTLFLVNTAAAEQGFSEAIIARSGNCLLLALMPTWMPDARKPLG